MIFLSYSFRYTMRYLIWIIIFVIAIRKINAERAKKWKSFDFTTMFKWGWAFVWVFFLVALIFGMLEQQKEESLSHDERIYKDFIHCQDSIRANIEKQYPTDSNNPIYWNWNTFNTTLFEKNAEKNLELSKTLYQQCDDSIIEKYHISTWELKRIENKAFNENWVWKL